tara:strand:+ start:564 stop:710 length:147 start_codon:yes stop_codon:yes gene_type:complete
MPSVEYTDKSGKKKKKKFKYTPKDKGKALAYAKAMGGSVKQNKTDGKY